ncbi:MAG: hypothetical protein ACK5JT_15420 [Hyphomicrobiaceae bacterium]
MSGFPLRGCRAARSRLVLRVVHALCVLPITVAMGVAAAQGEPLSTDACEKLRSEHADLVRAGLPDIVKKGPDWGRANLTAVQLGQVKKYIEVDEMLTFRCGLALPRQNPGGAEPEEAKESEGRAVNTAVPPLPVRNPLPAKSREAQPKVRRTTGASRPKQSSPAPRPKVNDAYRPPLKPGMGIGTEVLGKQ